MVLCVCVVCGCRLIPLPQQNLHGSVACGAVGMQRNSSTSTPAAAEGGGMCLWASLL